MNAATRQVIEKFQPYGTNILCVPFDVADKTEGGIIIPEMARSKLNQGTVLATGDQLDEDEWKGKAIMWTQHSESRLTIDGVTLVVVTPDNVVMRER